MKKRKPRILRGLNTNGKNTPILNANQPLLLNANPKHLYECKKGHKIIAESIQTFVAFWDGIKRAVCPKCMFDWAEDKEIIDMGEFKEEEPESPLSSKEEDSENPPLSSKEEGSENPPLSSKEEG